MIRPLSVTDRGIFCKGIDIEPSYRARITRPLFNGEKAARKRLFDAPCRWAKRSPQTIRYATRLQLSLGVLTVPTQELHIGRLEQARKPFISFSDLVRMKKIFSSRTLAENCISLPKGASCVLKKLPKSLAQARSLKTEL